MRLLALFAILLVPATASATPNFPGVVQSHLALDAPPDCSLCHVGTPGRGTVNTPFGTTIRSRGAQAYDESSLQTALDALKAEKKDSDGDGTGDIDELLAGADPNAGAGQETVIPDYGCAVTHAPTSPTLPAAALLLALVSIPARRRFRPSRGRAGSRGRSSAPRERSDADSRCSGSSSSAS